MCSVLDCDFQRVKVSQLHLKRRRGESAFLPRRGPLDDVRSLSAKKEPMNREANRRLAGYAFAFYLHPYLTPELNHQPIPRLLSRSCGQDLKSTVTAVGLAIGGVIGVHAERA
jgi:hypothetical protein